jgi:hypothetical protein
LAKEFIEFQKIREKLERMKFVAKKFGGLFKYNGKTFNDKITEQKNILEKTRISKEKKTKEIFEKYGYLLEMSLKMEGRNFRGMGSMINDGFPNAIIVKIENKEGLPFRFCVRAMDRIKKGKEILINYGREHLLKRFLPHIEINFKELKDFISKIKNKHPNDNYFLTSEFKNEFNAYCINEKEGGSSLEKILYIIFTPHTVLRVLDEVSIEDVLQCVKLIKEIWSLNQKVTLERFELFYLDLKKLGEKDKKLLRDLKEKSSTSCFFDLLVFVMENLGGDVKVF